jgi:hypothetical protein
MRIYIIGNDGNTLSREPLAEVNECYEATCRSTSISRAVRAATFWRSALERAGSRSNWRRRGSASPVSTCRRNARGRV